MLKKTKEQILELQNQASNPQNSAWVFASAGAGKTTVLVNRVLRLLLEGVRPDKILCITFTKIAAAEMQERIIKKLSEFVFFDDEKLCEEIFILCKKNPEQKQIDFARTLFARLCDDDFEIKIQTIHAFCQNLVKIFPFEIGVSPNFEIIDEFAAKNLLIKARKEVFAQANFDGEIRNIITEISARLSDEAFMELVQKLLDKKEKLGFLKIKFFEIDNLIRQIFKEFQLQDYVAIDERDFARNIIAKNKEIEEKIFADFMREFDLPTVKNLLSKLDEAKKVGDLKLKEKMQKFIDEACAEKIFLLEEIFLNQDGSPSKKLLTKDFAQDQEFIFALQEKFCDFSDALNSFKTALASTYLIKFVDEILLHYQILKKQNALLDYNDLIVKTNELLANPQHQEWVKFKLDGFFDHILVDESQDTNHAQWAIIKALSDDFFSGKDVGKKNRSLFIIGDDKQSIYGFQGAKSGISGEIFDFYQGKTDAIKKIDLPNSFRSLPKILQFVDEIFLNKDLLGSLNYQAHSAIRHGEGTVEVWPKITAQKQEKDALKWQNIFVNGGGDEEFCQKEEMAKKIAQEILLWVRQQKRVDYGDVMILLRKRTGGFYEILQRVFDENKIPFRGANKIKFSENLLIQDLLALASFVLLPRDDLNLAALLKSPFFNVSEDELLQFCLVKNERNEVFDGGLPRRAEGASGGDGDSYDDGANERYCEKLPTSRHCSKAALGNDHLSEGRHCEEPLGDEAIHRQRKLPKFTLLDAIKIANPQLHQKLEAAQNLTLRKNNAFDFYNSILTTEIKNSFAQEFGEIAFDLIDQFLLEVFAFTQKNLPNLQKFLDYATRSDPEISMIGADLDRVLISTVHSAKGLQAKIVILPDCCFNFASGNASRENLLWLDIDDANYGQAQLPIWRVDKKHDNKITKKINELRLRELKEEYFRLFYVALTRAEDELYISGFGQKDDQDSWYSLALMALEEFS